MSGYEDAYRRWQENPQGFWRAASQMIHWSRGPEAILDPSQKPSPAWFPGGEPNTCFNAVDRHVQDGRSEQTALIYDSPVTGIVRRYSYRQLRDEVAHFFGGLVREGVGRGDRVVIYMPTCLRP
jgi:propionyl-CoA synthetase